MPRLRARKPPQGKRTASGRASRSKVAMASKAQDVRHNTLMARKREFGVSYVQAANPMFGTALYRFRRLVSDHGTPLTGADVMAFEWLETAYHRYKKAIESPAAVYEPPKEGLTARPSERALERSAVRAINDWERVLRLMDAIMGKHRRERALNLLIHDGQDIDGLPLARRALEIVDKVAGDW